MLPFLECVGCATFSMGVWCETSTWSKFCHVVITMNAFRVCVCVPPCCQSAFRNSAWLGSCLDLMVQRECGLLGMFHVLGAEFVWSGMACVFGVCQVTCECLLDWLPFQLATARALYRCAETGLAWVTCLVHDVIVCVYTPGSDHVCVCLVAIPQGLDSHKRNGTWHPAALMTQADEKAWSPPDFTPNPDELPDFDGENAVLTDPPKETAGVAAEAAANEVAVGDLAAVTENPAASPQDSTSKGGVSADSAADTNRGTIGTHSGVDVDTEAKCGVAAADAGIGLD
eukprot:4020936-Amphidinium_carterae.2